MVVLHIEQCVKLHIQHLLKLKMCGEKTVICKLMLMEGTLYKYVCLLLFSEEENPFFKTMDFKELVNVFFIISCITWTFASMCRKPTCLYSTSCIYAETWSLGRTCLPITSKPLNEEASEISINCILSIIKTYLQHMCLSIKLLLFSLHWLPSSNIN